MIPSLGTNCSVEFLDNKMWFEEDRVIQYVKNGGNITNTNEDGETLIFKAILGGSNRFDCLFKLLLDREVDLERKKNNNDTLLHVGCIYKTCSPKKIYALLKKGANPNSLDSRCNTPLHMCKCIKKAGMLLDFGADINFKNKFGKTLLACTNDPRMIQFLISKGADINSKDKYGKSVLQRNVSEGYENAVKILLENGAKETGIYKGINEHMMKFINKTKSEIEQNWNW